MKKRTFYFFLFMSPHLHVACSVCVSVCLLPAAATGGMGKRIDRRSVGEGVAVGATRRPPFFFFRFVSPHLHVACSVCVSVSVCSGGYLDG